jgi:hypothetical protein
VDRPSVPLGDLRRLVRRYAANPNLSALLADTGERTWARLAGDARSDVWLISWPAGSGTGWHDHGDAAGAFAVASGVLLEETWALGAVQRRHLVAGDARSFGRHHVHNVHGAGPGRALTVHAYAPGLVTMGGYALTPDGPVPAATAATRETW